MLFIFYLFVKMKKRLINVDQEACELVNKRFEEDTWFKIDAAPAFAEQAFKQFKEGSLIWKDWVITSVSVPTSKQLVAPKTWKSVPVRCVNRLLINENVDRVYIEMDDDDNSEPDYIVTYIWKWIPEWEK